MCSEISVWPTVNSCCVFWIYCERSSTLNRRTSLGNLPRWVPQSRNQIATIVGLMKKLWSLRWRLLLKRVAWGILAKGNAWRWISARLKLNVHGIQPEVYFPDIIGGLQAALSIVESTESILNLFHLILQSDYPIFRSSQEPCATAAHAPSGLHSYSYVLFTICNPPLDESICIDKLTSLPASLTELQSLGALRLLMWARVFLLSENLQVEFQACSLQFLLFFLDHRKKIAACKVNNCLCIRAEHS